MKSTQAKPAYSPYASHEREIRKMDFDTAWSEWLHAEDTLAIARRRWPNGSRTVNTERAWSRGIERRLVELDRSVDSELNWSRAVGLVA